MAIHLQPQTTKLGRIFHTQNDNRRPSVCWSRSAPAAVDERTTARGAPWLHEIFKLERFSKYCGRLSRERLLTNLLWRTSYPSFPSRDKTYSRGPRNFLNRSNSNISHSQMPRQHTPSLRATPLHPEQFSWFSHETHEKARKQRVARCLISVFSIT